MTRTALLLLAIVAAALPAHAQPDQSSSAARDPVLVAQGSATVKRAPDRALVTFATEARAERPDEAQKRNAQAMQQVREALRKADVPEEAIRTVGFNLHEEADFVEGKRVIRGYLATNTIEVRVDDLNELGALMDRVVRAGATSIHGVQFDLKDRDAAEREALRLAVQDARARVDALAAGAGVRVRDVISVVEHGGREPGPPPMPMARTMAAEADVTTPIAPGEISIEATVTLTARIEQ